METTKEAVLRYARERLGTEPEYLWARTPEYAVLRRWDTGKWYAAILSVPREKLGLAGAESVDILDVKCPHQVMGALMDGKGYFPGYHMNKDSWLTILLDGTVPEKDIFELLELSYELTGKKARKRKEERADDGV